MQSGVEDCDRMAHRSANGQDESTQTARRPRYVGDCKTFGSVP